MSTVAETIHVSQSTNNPPKTVNRTAINQQIKSWADQVQDKPLPIFKKTRLNLEKFHDKPNSSIFKIVEILRLDPCYSHHIFATANHGLIKNNRVPATSLNHAILLLGVSQVIEIGKRLPLISDIKNPQVKSKVLQMISQSCHAAVQAREWMSDHGKTSAEAAFITAQLRDLYLVNLWYHTPEKVSRLLKTSSQQSLFNPKGMLTELGRNLTKRWHFSALLQKSFDPQEDSNRLIKTVSFACQVARLAESGWYTESMDHLIAQSVKTLGCSEDRIYTMTHRHAVTAARESLFHLSIPAASRLLDTGESDTPPVITATVPKPKKVAKRLPLKEKPVIKPPVNSFDKQLQRLIEMGKNKRSPQEILEFSFKLLDKISDKKPIVFFLLDRNKTFLKSRFTANFDQQTKSFSLPLNKKSIFLSLMSKQQSVWVNSKNRKKYTSLLSARFTINIKEKDFLAMSLFIQNKPIGLFYLENMPEQKITTTLQQRFIAICKTTSRSLEEVKKHAT